MPVVQYPHVWQLLQGIVLLNAIGFCGSVVANDDFNFNVFLLTQSNQIVNQRTNIIIVSGDEYGKNGHAPLPLLLREERSYFTRCMF